MASRSKDSRAKQLGRWTQKTAKSTAKFLLRIVLSIIVVLILIDAFTIYSSHGTAEEIASRALVVACQVLEQGGDSNIAREEATNECERNLAELKNIRITDRQVEVTVLYDSRSMILKHIPWVSKFTTIVGSSSAECD